MQLIPKNTNSGFTIIEVIITVAIFAMLAGGIYLLVSSILFSSGRQSRLLSGSDQARKVSFQITDELRNASTADTGAYSLNLATSTEIIFFSNVDGDSDIERVRYFAQNGKFYRGEIQPSGAPVTYNLGNEVISTVLDDLGNTSTPIFYYYDDTYNGTVNNYLIPPVPISSVSYVRTDIRVFLTGGIDNQQAYRITNGATIRNLKTNLGN